MKTHSLNFEIGDFELNEEDNNNDVKEKEIVQFELKDYLTYTYLNDSSKRKLQKMLSYLNKSLKRNKISLDDIKEYKRVDLSYVFKDVARHGTTYLPFLHFLLSQYISSENKQFFEHDLRYLSKKFQHLRNKKDFLQPDEIYHYLTHPNKDTDIITYFGILLQSIYGIRYSSLRFMRFDFNFEEFLESVKGLKEYNKFFTFNIFRNLYEEIQRKIYSDFLDYQESNIIQNSYLIQGPSIFFWWKGNRYEKFPLHDKVQKVAELVKRYRIQQIYLFVYQMHRKGKKINDIIQTNQRRIKYYRYWLLPLYFPYSHQWYRLQLKKIFKKDISYHDLRRAYATMLSKQGFSLVDIKSALRHADIKTTIRYVQVNPKLNSDIFGVIKKKMKEVKDNDNNKD